VSHRGEPEGDDQGRPFLVHEDLSQIPAVAVDGRAGAVHQLAEHPLPIGQARIQIRKVGEHRRHRAQLRQPLRLSGVQAREERRGQVGADGAREGGGAARGASTVSTVSVLQRRPPGAGRCPRDVVGLDDQRLGLRRERCLTGLRGLDRQRRLLNRRPRGDPPPVPSARAQIDQRHPPHAHADAEPQPVPGERLPGVQDGLGLLGAQRRLAEAAGELAGAVGRPDPQHGVPGEVDDVSAAGVDELDQLPQAALQNRRELLRAGVALDSQRGAQAGEAAQVSDEGRRLKAISPRWRPLTPRQSPHEPPG